MNKIKLRKMTGTWKSNIRETYYLSNAGDIKIIPESSWSTLVCSKEGLSIFGVGTGPKTFIFGYTDILIFDKTQFDFAPELLSKMRLLCFDPRIVMTIILIDILGEIHGADDNAWIKQVQEAINPVPTIEEAKDFLKRNKLFRDPDSYDPHYIPRINYPEDLVGIPEKVQALLKQGRSNAKRIK